MGLAALFVCGGPYSSLVARAPNDELGGGMGSGGFASSQLAVYGIRNAVDCFALLAMTIAAEWQQLSRQRNPASAADNSVIRSFDPARLARRTQDAKTGGFAFDGRQGGR